MNYYSGDSHVSNSKLWKGGGYDTFKRDVHTALSQLPQKIEKYRPSFSINSTAVYSLKELITDVNSAAKLVLGLVTLAEMEKPSSQESDHSKGAAIDAFIHACVQTLSQLSKLNQTFSEMLKFFKDEIKTEMMLEEYDEKKTKRILCSLNNQQASSLTIPKTTTSYTLCNSSSCQHCSTSSSPNSVSGRGLTGPNSFFPVSKANHQQNFSPNVPSSPSPFFGGGEMINSETQLVKSKKENIIEISKIIEDTSLDSKSSVLYLSLCVVQRAVHEHPKMITWLFGTKPSSSATR